MTVPSNPAYPESTMSPGDRLADLYPGSGAVSRFAQIEHLELFESDKS